MDELLSFIYGLMPEASIWPSSRGVAIIDPVTDINEKSLQDIIDSHEDLKGFKASVGYHNGSFMATVTKAKPKTQADVKAKLTSL